MACSLPRKHWACRNWLFPFWTAFFSLLAAQFIAPIFNAGTHPLHVRAEVGPGAALYVVLDDGWEAPLVAVGEGLYVCELPPRRSYHAWLRAEGGSGNVKELLVKSLADRPIESLVIWFKGSNTSLAEGQKIRFECFPKAGVEEWLLAFFGTYCFLWLLGYGLRALWVTHLPEWDGEAHRHGPGPLWALFAVGAALHILLVTGANPLFWPADSIGYASNALRIYDGGCYFSGGIIDALSRAPGCSFVEALGWTLFGFSSSSVVLVQALLYCGAALFALDALCRRFGRLAAGIAALPLLLSPVAIQFVRIYASEAPFMAFSLMGAACMLRGLDARGRALGLWMLGGSFATALAVLTRPNGVVLLAMPLFMVGRAGVQILRSRGFSSLRPLRPWLLPPLAVGLTLFVWSFCAWHQVGYFSPSDIVGLSKAEAGFKSGIVDLRSACNGDEALYEELTLARFKSGYNFEAWALKGILKRRHLSAEPAWGDSRRLDLMLAKFAEDGCEPLPGRMMMLRFARGLVWGLWVLKDTNFQPYGRPDYRFVTYPDGDWAYTNELIAGWVHPDLTIEQQAPGFPQRAYNAVLIAYPSFYVLLVAVGLLAFALACVKGWPGVLLFLLPAFGNLLFNAWLGVVISRYVMVFEPFLWLGVAAALARFLADRTSVVGCKVKSAEAEG